MAAVTSYGPLYDRIYEALCTSTGKVSALAAADLFQRGFPNGVDPAKRVMLARERPTVFVDVVRQQARGGDQELHTEKVFLITVQISVDFFLGWPMTAIEKRSTGFNEVADAQVRSSSAFPKAVDALCYPNAHDTVTASGADTGLDGGALTREGAIESRGAIATLADGRLLNTLWTFPNCTISWASAA